MEVVVVVLLIIIIYQLAQMISRQQTKEEKGPVFTRQEGDEAVSEWYSTQYDSDLEKGLIGKPGWSIWRPPPYDEVKNDRNALDSLREMSRKTKSRSRSR